MEVKNRCRLTFLGVVFLLWGCYLAYRLYYLQVVENVEWAFQAVNQRSDGLALYRQRGAILDCHGNPLTGRDHRPYLAIFPALLTAEEQKAIRELLVGDQVWLKGDEYSPLTIAGPSAALLRYVSERSIRGVTFCTVPLRYGIKPIAHHLLGYVHPATGKGLAGLEAAYEKDLASGQTIKLTVMTDALKRPIPGLSWRYQKEAGTHPGRNLVITLDLALQSKIEALLDAARIRKGAVVVMEVGTGKIRALASRPVFDPYVPQQSLQDPDQSLQNRALTAYPPGPLLNPIIMAAALEGKPVLDMAKNCGFGTASGWGIPGAESGFLPTELGTDGHDPLGTGEKEITVTPVQIAAALQVVAGNGNYCPPIVVEGLQRREEEGEPLAIIPLQPGRPVLTGPTVAALQDMLEAAVPQGTGQLGQMRQGLAGLGGTVFTGQAYADPQSCSWFAGYAPVQAACFVGVVLLEDVPNGAETAATLFANMMGECLGRQ